MVSWRKRTVHTPSQGAFFRLSRALAALLVLLVVGGGVYVYWAWHRPLNPGPDTYVLKPGTTLRGLARQLSERSVITEPYTFTWLGYLSGHSRQLKAGEYRFPPNASASQVLRQVVAGRVVEYPLVLVEGWNFRQVMSALEAAPKLTKTLAGLEPEEVMVRLGHPDAHPEGRFFPDTYYYSQGHTDVQVLKRAFERMQATLNEEWSKRADGLPLRTKDEALVLASIIEKETARPEERRLIAGVFINRLRKGMRLQTDPTVIYGLGTTFDGNLRLKDLRSDTEYNTYTRAGLPPTPIAMPGRESVAAALNPEKTPALYFVSRGDGSHVFSATLEEHMGAVTKYQLGGSGRAPAAPKGGSGSTGGGS